MSALRVTGGRREPGTARTTVTDDLGEFRLFALSPADYILQASAQMANGGPSPETADSQDGYATTFFPGVLQASEAKRITLGIGQIVEDVSFVIQPARGARVSGTAIDSKGRPLTGMLMVMRKSNGNMMGNGWPIRPDGTFVLTNMAREESTLEASRFGGDDEPEVRPWPSRLPVKTSPTSASSPRRTSLPLAASSPIPRCCSSRRWAACQSPVIPARPDDMLPGPLRPARVNDDLSFELKSPPGRMRSG